MLPNVNAAPVVTAISQVGNDTMSVDVYDMRGVLLRHNANPANATMGLPAGVYVIDGKKVLVK